VAVDSAGNLYVADPGNNLIRKVTPAGVVTTLAGSVVQVGAYGADGTGSAASFFQPASLAVDSAGTVYVTDTRNGTIRKITPGGVVSTLAGYADPIGIQDVDGTGTVAAFAGPDGIAVDSAGNLYVADGLGDTIREVTPAGVVTTLAGSPYVRGSADGTGSSASFENPQGVALDKAGNLYVADQGNNTIRKITAAGGVTTLAGTAGQAGYQDGLGSAARFDGPTGVAVDSAGNVYVADSGNEVIRMITPAGSVTTLAETAGKTGFAYGTAGAALFNEPEGIAVDNSGSLYIADTQNAAIRKIIPTAGSGGTSWAVSTLAGLDRVASGDGTGSGAWFNYPEGVAVDGEGSLYVADSGNNTIREITPAGVVTTIAGSLGTRGSADGTGTAASFWFPAGIAVGGAGTLYVADEYNDTIRMLSPATSNGVPTWEVTTIAGTAGNYGSSDGTGGNAEFDAPSGIAVDNAGNLYVSDRANSTIRKIAPTTAGGATSWVVTTLAGSPGVPGDADGTGSAASFTQPTGIAVDPSGNVFVGDVDNGDQLLREITPAGVVTTLANTGLPFGVATDAAGNAYVTMGISYSASNSSLPPQAPSAPAMFFNVQKITPAGVVSVLAGPTTPGSEGSADGTGSAVEFFEPYGIAVDVSGNIFVADSGNNTIRRGNLATGIPSIAIEPESQTVNTGGTVEFSIAAVGWAQSGPGSSAPTYQWQFDGTNLSDGNGVTGSASPQLLVQGLGAAGAGDYDCVVTIDGVSTQSYSAILSVVPTTTPTAVTSLSGRAFVGTGDNILIGGFYITGSTSATVLVQAIGPALAATPYNVTGTLQHPALSIHQNQNAQDVVLYSNTGWGSSPVLLAAAAAAYAQPGLQPGSADSEVLLTLPPGGYTAEVTGADGGTGVALCAIYQLP
jgi:sugar lactone lactonase YvrE